MSTLLYLLGIVFEATRSSTPAAFILSTAAPTIRGCAQAAMILFTPYFLRRWAHFTTLVPVEIMSSIITASRPARLRFSPSVTISPVSLFLVFLNETYSDLSTAAKASTRELLPKSGETAIGLLS